MRASKAKLCRVKARLIARIDSPIWKRISLGNDLFFLHTAYCEVASCPRKPSFVPLDIPVPVVYPSPGLEAVRSLDRVLAFSSIVCGLLGPVAGGNFAPRPEVLALAV